MTPTRPLAVGVTPMETRREVIREVAVHAERCGYSAFFVAEGWGHDASVLLAESYYQQSRMNLNDALASARSAVARAPDFAFGWARVDCFSWERALGRGGRALPGGRSA